LTFALPGRRRDCAMHKKTLDLGIDVPYNVNCAVQQKTSEDVQTVTAGGSWQRVIRTAQHQVISARAAMVQQALRPAGGGPQRIERY
jgi:hypothetical protein